MTTTVHEPIKVRLLGGLRVVRSDGSTVDSTDWRTNKTRDLLCLLALEVDRPVPRARLDDLLWPKSSPDRARASLRTATFQIRRTLGPDHLLRCPEGLVLADAVVDTVQLVELAGQVQLAARRLDHERVLALVRQAEEVYVDDFHASDDASDWARSERERLLRVRRELVCQGAVAAVELRFFREAIDLAQSMLQLDSTSEIAHRVLMRAHAGVGEVPTALRLFASYRERLADELGADPSPQTRELHRELLRSTAL